jgi:KUP system potassium uptake protein
LHQYKIAADFRFVIMEKFLSYNNSFGAKEGFILNSYFAIKKLAQTEAKAFGLDTSETYVEKIPLVVKPVGNIVLKRIEAAQPVSIKEPVAV